MAETPTPHGGPLEHADWPHVRSFDELRTSGLLWLINASVFHPRGLALALVMDEDGTGATGWALYGNGDEPLVFADGPLVDEAFRAAQTTLTAPHPPLQHADDEDVADG